MSRQRVWILATSVVAAGLSAAALLIWGGYQTTPTVVGVTLTVTLAVGWSFSVLGARCRRGGVLAEQLDGPVDDWGGSCLVRAGDRGCRQPGHVQCRGSHRLALLGRPGP